MRSVTRKLATTSMVAVAGLAAVLSGMGTASADPGTTPAATDIVAMGSDTIQSFDNGLSAAYNATSPTSNFYSWDATGSSPLVPKTGGNQIARANGSSSGITALNSTTNATLDIARSSRPPQPGNTDWFIPFATDAVGWAAATGGNAPTNLSSADLQGIYNCSITSWSQITDVSGYTGPNTTIQAFVPQNGSGTRAFFLSALGIAASSEPCWQSVTPEENEGTDPAFQNNPDAIFPYSLAHYVGQVYDNRGGGSDLPGYLDANRSIDGVNQIDTTKDVFNSALPLAYSRQVYHVVRQSDWSDPTEGPRLKALLGRAAAGGWLCANGSTLISSYGFQPLGAACGTLQPGV